MRSQCSGRLTRTPRGTWNVGVLPIVLTTLTLGCVASAQAGLDVRLTSASGLPGQDVILSLTQQSVPDRTATTISLDMAYDPAQLSVKTYANGAAIEANEFVLVDTTKTPGKINIVVADLAKVGDPLFGLLSGEMLRVTFTIKATATSGTMPLPLQSLVALDQAGKNLSPITQTDGAVTIMIGNRAPVAQDQAVTLAEDASRSITLVATDADNDPLRYAVISAPLQGTLSGSAPQVTYTPTPNFNGTDRFTFTANDGKMDSNGATVSLTVTAVNDAPVAQLSADPLSGIAPMTVAFDAGGSSDVEGPLASYDWSFGDGATGSGVSVSHTYSTAGSYQTVLTVIDQGGVSATASAMIAVSSANQAPVVNAGADQTISLPSSAVLDGTVTDDRLPNPPGAVTTRWSQVSGPGMVTFENVAAVDTTASVSVAGIYILRLTASDGDLTSSDDMTLTANPAAFVDATPPTVTITQPVDGAFIARRSSLSIQASAFDNVRVAQVGFYVNGRLKCTVSTAPYSCVWKVPAKAGKSYQLQATASDATGNVGTSPLVTVTAK